MLAKSLVSPLDSKEIEPVNPKGNQPWIFIGRTDAEAEAPKLWPPDMKSWLFGKDPNAGKDWGQEEKIATEDDMVGWHHWFNGHEVEQTQGDSEGQGSLVYCILWSHKESDTTFCIALHWKTTTVLTLYIRQTSKKILNFLVDSLKFKKGKLILLMSFFKLIYPKYYHSNKWSTQK